jgi:hypothetical protein
VDGSAILQIIKREKFSGSGMNHLIRIRSGGGIL